MLSPTASVARPVSLPSERCAPLLSVPLRPFLGCPALERDSKPVYATSCARLSFDLEPIAGVAGIATASRAPLYRCRHSERRCPLILNEGLVTTTPNGSDEDLVPSQSRQIQYGGAVMDDLHMAHWGPERPELSPKSPAAVCIAVRGAGDFS